MSNQENQPMTDEDWRRRREEWRKWDEKNRIPRPIFWGVMAIAVLTALWQHMNSW